MPAKTYSDIKNDFLYELDYVTFMGSKIFAYPFIAKSKTTKFGYCVISFLVILTVVQLFLTLLQTGFKDWYDIVNVTPNLWVVFIASIKYTTLHVRRDVYDRNFKHCRDDLFNVVCDCKKHLLIVSKYTSVSKFVSRFVFYYSMPLIIIIDSFPKLIMYYESNVLGREIEYLYPFDGWYPFDKIKFYYVAYIWESFLTCIVLSIFGFVSMVNTSLTIYICMELKVLGTCINDLITPNDVNNIALKKNVKKTHFHIKDRLRNIICRHQRLAYLVTEFDGVLGNVMLLNYIFSSVFICLTIFTATVVDNLFKSLRYFFMFSSLLIEIFYQCLMGQVLSNHSEALSESIYSTHWPSADKETKILLLILLTRTQKPFQLTANGYQTMNLETFSGVCSFSYQLFNLLRTYYS